MQHVGIRIGLPVGIFLSATAAWIWWQGRADRYADSCRRALAERRWEKLAELSESWSGAAPADAEAWLYRAEAAQRQQDFDAACRFLRNIPPDSTFGVHALESRIELHFGPLNQPLAAVESCQALLKRDPESKLAHQRLIYFFAFTLQRRRMMDQIREAVARGCEPREAYTYLFLVDSLLLSNAGSQNARWLLTDPSSELFSVAQAVHIAETLEGQIPRDSPQVLAQVKESIARKDRTLDDLFAKYPANLELLAYFLRQAVEQGNSDRVADLLAKSPVDAESDHRFWRYRGWLFQSHDDLVEAESAYRQALKLNPLDGGTRHFLAGLLRRKGDLPEAGQLERIALHANQLRRLLQQQKNARLIPQQVLIDLADYAAECEDLLIADSLRAQLRRFDNPTDPKEYR